jgi:hypothetical protein
MKPTGKDPAAAVGADALIAIDGALRLPHVLTQPFSFLREAPGRRREPQLP